MDPGQVNDELAADGWYALSAVRDRLGRDEIEPMTINPEHRRGRRVFFFGRVDDAAYDPAAKRTTLRLREMEPEAEKIATGSTTTYEAVEDVRVTRVEHPLAGDLLPIAVSKTMRIRVVPRRYTTYAWRVRWAPKTAVVETALPGFDASIRRGNIYAIYATASEGRREDRHFVPQLNLNRAWLLARPR